MPDPRVAPGTDVAEAEAVGPLLGEAALPSVWDGSCVLSGVGA
ncbi:hypothetical protein [Streptomyces sp. B8F3]